MLDIALALIHIPNPTALWNEGRVSGIGCAVSVVLVLSTLIITLWYIYVHQGKTGQETPF